MLLRDAGLCLDVVELWASRLRLGVRLLTQPSNVSSKRMAEPDLSFLPPDSSARRVEVPGNGIREGNELIVVEHARTMINEDLFATIEPLIEGVVESIAFDFGEIVERLQTSDEDLRHAFIEQSIESPRVALRGLPDIRSTSGVRIASKLDDEKRQRNDHGDRGDEFTCSPSAGLGLQPLLS